MNAIWQERRWVVQIAHLIKEFTEKVIGLGNAVKNPQKTGFIYYLFEGSDHPNHTKSAVLIRVGRVSQGQTSI